MKESPPGREKGPLPGPLLKAAAATEVTLSPVVDIVNNLPASDFEQRRRRAREAAQNKPALPRVVVAEPEDAE